MTDFIDFLPLFQETMATIRERMDADLNAGLDPSDERNVDTRPGGFYFDITQPVLMEMARLWDAIATEVPAAASPASAWGDYLDNHAEVFGLERKEATAATGQVRFNGDPGAVVGTGTIVAASSNDPTAEPPEFQTTGAGTIGAQLSTPGAPTVTPATGGTMAAGSYGYAISALSDLGETGVGPVAAPATVVLNGKATLTWTAVSGAIGYVVYRRATTTDPLRKLTTVLGAATYVDDGSAALTTVQPPASNLSAGVTLPVEAIEPGITGNVAAAAIDELSSAVPGVAAVTNDLPLTGGGDPETDEELRVRLLRAYQGQGAGTVNDYIRWATEYPGVGRASVEPLWNGPGTVRVQVLTAEGQPVSATVVSGLQALLDPIPGKGSGLAPIGAIVTVATPVRISVNVTAAVVFMPGYSLDGTAATIAIRANLETAIQAYLIALGVGENVIKNHIIGAIITTTGIQDVTVSAPAADTTIGPTELAYPGTITLTERGPYVP